ncbi:MAG: hypothetical protein ACI8W8_002801, partial [Rhodothermales bacterium]
MPIYEHLVTTYPENVQHRSGLMNGYFYAKPVRLRACWEAADRHFR